MQSPLEVSQISLSQSRSSNYSQTSHSHGSRMFDVESPSVRSAAKDFLYQRQLAPNAVPLLVRLQRLRILITATIGVSFIIISMYFLQDGIVLKSYRVFTNDIKPRTEIDVYNGILGLVLSILVKPLIGLVTAVVPAVLLCFLTQVSMEETSSKTSRFALALLGNVVLYLLLNGMMAMYVSEKIARVDAVINDSDLAQYERNSIETRDQTLSLDTILRNAMQMAEATAENARGQCTRPSPQRLPAQVDYGFPSRQWLSEFLPSAPAKTDTNTLLISMKNDNTSLQKVTMPMELTAARNLMTFALRATDDFFRPQDVQVNASLMELSLDLNSSSNGDVEALLKATNVTLNRAVNARVHLRNFSIAETKIEFVQFPWTTDSGQVMFQGVTLEIPMKKEYLRREVRLQDDTTASVVYGTQALDGLYEINAKEECGRNGCVVSPVGATMSTAPVDQGSQVRALPICLNANGDEDIEATMSIDGNECPVRSTDSVLVLSFAKRIVGDAISSSIVNDSNTEATIVMLTNARQIYQVTAGRLSWETTDLASKYHASCEAKTCHGLVFPLYDDSREVILSRDHVPVSNLSSYSPSLLLWTPLVTSNVQEVDMSDILKSDFVFPYNFIDSSGWTPVDGSHCERERGMFMDRVQTSHLYSERSLQPAYQSALFWLFQHGVVKQKTNDLSLVFDNNVKYMDIILSVPQLSAILTFVGCTMLMMMALLIFFGGKSREADIERHFKPHHLARILLDDEEFSHRLLKCDLLNVGNKYLNSSELLDQFEISGLALRHRKRPSDVLIVPNAQQSTTLSAASTQAAHVV
ncbi:uncharacterized protein PHALS_00683 [Plasmopara halstedii]|uniref:Transmembrane protein n=1 Tax=Plasmopara halstedii TaxID=4781 RepID=A0A0P1AUH1_PLAHL|nr:uncharacterized protein PHALS_00683 [Plasmopara halstedii]CEG44314.1 hypothetical protein PHALS_00683 [Plasmopara halstedii]|eukprot:XP_024580683.1 hypothetical protein PHALS_00683 [Plasmopara halstedii]